MSLGVVIVNYNCAPLALDAALSVLGDDPSAKIIIVDNKSSDDSCAYFQDVMNGTRPHRAPRQSNVHPAPVYASLDQLEKPTIIDVGNKRFHQSNITIIKSKNNGGFASGANIGLRAFADQTEIEYILLLNPDAVLASGAVIALINRLSDQSVGLCGASIMRFAPPFAAQALGGARLGPISLLGQNIAAECMLADRPSRESVEKIMDYPLGAAIGMRREFLKRLGLLDECFFLYYEEVDWALRARRLLPCGWARNAVIYHHHGATAGSRLKSGGRSALSDFHMARSRFLFALKWRPYLLPILLILTGLQALNRFRRGRFAQARALLQSPWRRTLLRKSL